MGNKTLTKKKMGNKKSREIVERTQLTEVIK